MFTFKSRLNCVFLLFRFYFSFYYFFVVVFFLLFWFSQVFIDRDRTGAANCALTLDMHVCVCVCVLFSTSRVQSVLQLAITQASCRHDVPVCVANVYMCMYVTVKRLQSAHTSLSTYLIAIYSRIWLVYTQGV